MLVDNPSPTDQEIAEAIEGNLCRCTGYQQIIESIQEAAKIHRGEVAPPTPASILIRSPSGWAWRAVDASWPREVSIMSAGYRQQPGNSSSKRTDGKRIAGKQVFPPPGSGGSRPQMKERDLDYIPESVGGKEPQPAGSHIHDRIRTGTVVGKSLSLVDSNAKVTGQAWYGDDVRLPNETIGKILRSPHHYAKIKSIDTSRVEALPGVIAVATGQDASNSFEFCRSLKMNTQWL